jgi:DNA polymerase-3 subunit epsilon
LTVYGRQRRAAVDWQRAANVWGWDVGVISFSGHSGGDEAIPVHGFTVIDFETTGFRGTTVDRVVEVGVVCLDADGNVDDEWTSLINPEREVSATRIHGISARDVYAAPQFKDVAGLLCDSIKDRVLVAHNLAFEAQFLAGEFGRLHYDLGQVRGLCTMQLARHYLPATPRNLQSCCACCGYEIKDAHSALADAYAAAHVLWHFIQSDGSFGQRWLQDISASLQIVWPVLPADRSRLTPRDSQTATSRRDSFLGKLAARLPAQGGSGSLDNYLEVLDRALIDRILTLPEIDELTELAVSLGISHEQVRGAHHEYLETMVARARADGVITAEELADLRLLADLLGLDRDVALAGVVPGQVLPAPGFILEQTKLGAFALEPGDKVVFTGEVGGLERDVLIAEASALGLKPTESVSRFTKLVVAADPNSLSGKARKARAAGVPIVDFVTYQRLIGGLSS